MFDQLYVPAYALARHRGSPLVDERRRFLTHCAQRGTKRGELRWFASSLLRITDRLNLANRPLDRISREELVQKLTMGGRIILVAIHWLRFLDRFEEPPLPVHPFGKEIDDFVAYMRCEMGMAESTVSYLPQVAVRICSAFRRQL
jgi:hypothetical protein